MLAQFRLETVPAETQAHVESVYPADEIPRVNNLAWQLIMLKGWTFNAAPLFRQRIAFKHCGYRWIAKFELMPGFSRTISTIIASFIDFYQARKRVGSLLLYHINNYIKCNKSCDIDTRHLSAIKPDRTSASNTSKTADAN